MRFFSITNCFKLAVGALIASSALAFGQYDNGCCYDDCSDPCCSDGLLNGIEVGAEFLYWQPYFDDLDFAFSTSTDSTDSTGSSSGGGCPGRFHHFEHDWVPAFRVFAGLKKDMCCGMNVCLSYTRVENTRNRSLSADNNSLVSSFDFGPFSSFADLASFTAISGNHKFTYNDIDLLFSHDFCLTECHHFTPFFGVEGLNLDDRTHTFAEAIINDDSSASSLFSSSNEVISATHHRKNDFWGVGLKCGAEYRFQLFDSLSLYGNAAGSILWGEAKTHFREEIDFNSSSSESQEFILSTTGGCSKRWRMVPGYRIGVGFRYDTCICDWNIVGTLGYEFIDWFNMPRAHHFIGDSDRGRHVGFQGLNLGLAVRF